MIFKQKIEKNIWALIFISLGGWLLHVRVHPTSFIAGEPTHPVNLIPFVFGVLNIIVVPILFNFKKTVLIAYLINGFGVIIGTITMAHVSLANWPETVSLSYIFLRTTLPDIFLLVPKLFIAQVILNHYFPSGTGRFFTPFWWTKHFAYLSVVYYLGNSLWR